VLIVKDDGYQIQTTPRYPSDHNLIKQVLSIKVDEGEAIRAEKTVFSFGLYDQVQRYWLLYTAPELVDQSLTEKIQDLSIGAKLEDYTVHNLNTLNVPVILQYRFHGPEFFTAGGNLRILPQLASLDTSLVAQEKRAFAIDLGYLDSKETVTEVQLAPGYRVKYLPENIDEESPWMRCSIVYGKKDAMLSCTETIALKKTRIETEEYTDFKKFFEGLAKRVKQRVILEKIK